MAVPSYGSQDWIGGSINSPYRTLSDQFSAFQKDAMMQKMFEHSAQASAQQALALPNSMLGEFMQAGMQNMTGTHQQNMQQAVAGVLPRINQLFQSPQLRSFFDSISGGSSIGSATLSLGAQYKRLYDPITGNIGLDFDSWKAMSDAGYARIFGDVNNPNAAGLYGAGASELVPLMNFMNRHAGINTTLERTLFDEKFLQDVQSAADPASRNRYRAMLQDAGMTAQDVDEFMKGGNAYDSTQMQDFMRRASGGRIYQDAKELKNLTNAIRELFGPEVVTNVNEALAALQSLAGSQLSQFSSQDLEGIVRNGTNALRAIGLSAEEFGAYNQYSSQRAARMGYQGAMGLTNVGYMANERMSMAYRGAMASLSYGLWNENQLVQAIGDQRLAYGKSEMASLQAGMLTYAQSGGEFADNEAGRNLRKVIENLTRTGSGGESWDAMTMDERMTMFQQGMKGSNALAMAMEYAGNSSLVEGVQGNNPALLDSGKYAARAEMERYANKWAEDAAAKAGFGSDLTDSMVKSFFALSNGEAKSPVLAAEAVARRMMNQMSDAEKNKYGATDDERIRKLQALAMPFISSAMAESNTGANLGNFLNQYGDNAMASYDAVRDYNALQAQLEDATQGMMTEGLGDLVGNLVASANQQMKDTGSVSIRSLIGAAFSTMGPGDEKNKAKLQEVLGGLADQQEQMMNRYAELQAGGQEDSIEGKNIKNKLKMIEKYMTTFDEVLEGKLNAADEVAEAKQANAASSGGAVFNNLVMNMPNNMEIRVGDVIATPQSNGAVN